MKRALTTIALSSLFVTQAMAGELETQVMSSLKSSGHSTSVRNLAQSDKSTATEILQRHFDGYLISKLEEGQQRAARIIDVNGTRFGLIARISCEPTRTHITVCEINQWGEEINADYPAYLPATSNLKVRVSTDGSKLRILSVELSGTAKTIAEAGSSKTNI